VSGHQGLFRLALLIGPVCRLSLTPCCDQAARQMRKILGEGKLRTYRPEAPVLEL
jgi:hypothetical protein